MGLAAFNLKRRQSMAAAEAARVAAEAAKNQPTPAASATITAGGGAGGQTLVSTNGGPAVPPAATTGTAGAEPLKPLGNDGSGVVLTPGAAITNPAGAQPGSIDAPKITAGAADSPATREAHAQSTPGTLNPEKIAKLAEMTIPEVIEAVNAGTFTRDEAAALEAAGKNRQTLIKRLTETLD
jgi:hypothetical protein